MADESVYNPFIAVAIFMVGLFSILFILIWIGGLAYVDECEYKGELTDFADTNLIELDNEAWVKVRLNKYYSNWENRVYNGEPVYKCVGHRNLDLTPFEVWRIGD